MGRRGRRLPFIEMPIATRDPTKTPSPFAATDRAAKIIGEQERTFQRLFGSNFDSYFRLQDQLRRAALGPMLDRSVLANWSATARAANVGGTASILKSVRETRSYALTPGIGATADPARGDRTGRLGAGVLLPSGIVRSPLGANARQNPLGDTAATVGGINAMASVSAKASLLACTSASALAITAQVHERHRLILEQNNALLGMSIKRTLAAQGIPSLAAALDAHKLATNALIGGAITRAVLDQMRVMQDVLRRHDSTLGAASALRRSLLANELVSKSIARSLLGMRFAKPSITMAFDIRNTALGGLSGLALRDWLIREEPPTWEEIYGVALRELRAEFRRDSLGYSVQVHVALLVLEAMLTTTPALPAQAREEIHKGFLLAHAIALSAASYRRTLR